VEDYEVRVAHEMSSVVKPRNVLDDVSRNIWELVSGRLSENDRDEYLRMNGGRVSCSVDSCRSRSGEKRTGQARTRGETDENERDTVV